MIVIIIIIIISIIIITITITITIIAIIPTSTILCVTQRQLSRGCPFLQV